MMMQFRGRSGPRETRRNKQEMSHKDIDYYQRRAEAEIELAQRSPDARAVRVHYELASAYLDRIHGDAPQSGPNILSS